MSVFESLTSGTQLSPANARLDKRKKRLQSLKSIDACPVQGSGTLTLKNKTFVNNARAHHAAATSPCSRPWILKDFQSKTLYSKIVSPVTTILCNKTPVWRRQGKEYLQPRRKGAVFTNLPWQRNTIIYTVRASMKVSHKEILMRDSFCSFYYLSACLTNMWEEEVHGILQSTLGELWSNHLCQ